MTCFAHTQRRRKLCVVGVGPSRRRGLLAESGECAGLASYARGIGWMLAGGAGAGTGGAGAGGIRAEMRSVRLLNGVAMTSAPSGFQ